MCMPLCFPKDKLDRMKLFPDPMIKDDGQNQSVEEVYGTEILENW